MLKTVPPAFIMLALLVSFGTAGQSAETSDLPYDLKQVSGMHHFPQDPDLRAILAKNGFVVVPNKQKRCGPT